MTIIKIRRGKSHHRVGELDVPYYDYFNIESKNGAIPRLTPLNNKDEDD